MDKYFEEQSMRDWWVVALIVVMAAGGWFQFVLNVIILRDMDSVIISVIVVVVVGTILPVLLWKTKLTIVVEQEEVLIKYRGAAYTNVQIAFSDIAEAFARDYSPIKEYGGWGIRGSDKKGRAYNMSGTQGVQLTLKDGKRILIGSQRSSELLAAINGNRARV